MKRGSCHFYLLVFLALFLRTSSVSAQEDLALKIFTTSRVGMTHSSDLPAAGELHFSIGHRFGEIKGGLYNMFGLDLATIRLGFDYGLADRITIGTGRSTWEKTYDFYLKTGILEQSENGFPFSLTGLATWSIATLHSFYPESNSGFTDRSSFSGQLLLARRQGKVSFKVSPSAFRNNFEVRDNRPLLLFYFPVTTAVRITKRLAISLQYIPVINRPSYSSENPLSFGFDIDTGGHQFQLIFSNSTGVFEKNLLTNTEGIWGDGKIYFGFNLIRVFYIK